MRPGWQSPLYEPVTLPLGATVTLTNVGTSFDATTAAKGLGFARADFTNVTNIEFTVRWNKVGTGTLSWQLWNDTDGAQLAIITDAAAAGDNKSSTVNAAVSLSGIKQMRVRASSTVGADDPIFYGACVVLT
jgi:hypothetical protein